MKATLILAGGSGFMGIYLARYFREKGYDIVILSREKHRDAPGIRYVVWDGETPGAWVQVLNRAEVLINLAGKSVNCRYNDENKRLITESRVKSTAVLGEAIRRCEFPPKVWINAATATIYRHAEDRPMTEDDGEKGEGFSVEVAKAWEKTFGSYAAPEVRQVLLRIAIVLGNDPGGPLASGHQMFSWLHIHDLAQIIDWTIHNPEATGIYNCSASEPVSNARFMQALCTSMQVPLGIRVRMWMLKIGALLLQTELELVLKSRWVLPERLLREGFVFEFPEIEKALADLQQGLLLSKKSEKGSAYSKSVGSPTF